jgi:undecaprenyl-diphosphatase
MSQPAWEAQLMRWQQAGSPAPLRWLAEALSFIGQGPPSVVIALTAAGALARARHRLLAVLVIGALLLRTLSPVLKELVERPRPSPELVDVANQLSTASFPSGHVLGATLLYGFLAYAAEFSIAGYARVEMGEHWPTDVIGGWLIGLLLVIGLAWVHQRARENTVHA